MTHGNAENENAAAADLADLVDIGVAQWRKERPDLDPSAKMITSRILLLNDIILKSYNSIFNSLNIKYPMYVVLTTLRGSGEPFAMSPSAIYNMMVVSSGGLSKILNRLDEQGLVTRQIDPNDGRGVIVQLTDEGKAVIDKAMEIQERAEHRLVRCLSAEEQEMITVLLRKLVVHNGGRFFSPL